MAETGNVIRGPWRKSTADPARLRPALHEGDAPVRVLLGYLTRECVDALGHEPTPRELADWANHQRDERGEFCLFGRKINPDEARVILAHPGREVTVRRARFSPASPGNPRQRLTNGLSISIIGSVSGATAAPALGGELSHE